MQPNELNKNTMICQLTPNMKSVNVNFIVLDTGQVRRTPQGADVRTMKVADPTGMVTVGLWNDVGDYLSPGDICKLRNGYTTTYRGSLTLSCSRGGELIKTGDFFMAIAETPNMSEYNPEYDKKPPNNRKGPPEEEFPGGNSGNGHPGGGGGGGAGGSAGGNGGGGGGGSTPAGPNSAGNSSASGAPQNAQSAMKQQSSILSLSSTGAPVTQQQRPMKRLMSTTVGPGTAGRRSDNFSNKIPRIGL